MYWKFFTKRSRVSSFLFISLINERRIFRSENYFPFQFSLGTVRGGRGGGRGDNQKEKVAKFLFTENEREKIDRRTHARERLDAN